MGNHVLAIIHRVESFHLNVEQVGDSSGCAHGKQRRERERAGKKVHSRRRRTSNKDLLFSKACRTLKVVTQLPSPNKKVVHNIFFKHSESHPFKYFSK